MSEQRRAAILDYLVEVLRLRSPIQRDLEKGAEEVLWLADVPQEKGCWCRAWGPDEDRDETTWVEVSQAPEPSFPALPPAIEPWVEVRSGHPDEKVPPRLRESILGPQRESEDPDQPPPPREHRHLKDHPGVSPAFQRWLNDKWSPWCELHRRWRRVHQAYTTLFTIHQAQQRLGEQYELVVGFGLLQWKRPGQDVRRHVLTARASLVFEASRGLFRVGPPVNGTELAVELDMLEVGERPPGLEREAQDGVAAAADDPWSRMATDAVLSAIAHSLHDQGHFDPNAMQAQRGAPEAPVISWAPALMLRKQGARSVQQFFERIRQRIAVQGETTSLWDDLSEITKPDGVDRSASKGQRDRAPPLRQFLPLPANEEQLRILQRLAGEQGILVQGPPGTGKSHTIANLICHLLATKQRVLVTAQTPRALRVLQDKLPDAIRPLCISVLGAAREDREALERSVHGILQNAGSWDTSREGQRIKGLEQKFDALSAERASRERELREIREADSYEHVVADGAYRGTSQRVGQAIDRESAELGWIPDDVDPATPVPLDEVTFRRLITHLRRRTPERDSELRQWWVTPAGQLPDATEIGRLIAEEANASAEAASRSDPELDSLLSPVPAETMERLSHQLGELRARVLALNASGPEWLGRALDYALEVGPTRWVDLAEQTEAVLQKCGQAARRIDLRKVTAPQGIDDVTLLRQAQRLLDHLAAGGRMGVFPFRTAAVRQSADVWKRTQVNGQLCNDLASVKDLVEHLHTCRMLDHLVALWRDVAPVASGARGTQAIELHERARLLREVLSVHTAAVELRGAAVSSHAALAALPWLRQGMWARIIGALSRRSAVYRAEVVRARFAHLAAMLQSERGVGGAHPAMGDLCRALAGRDMDAWGAARRALLELDEARTQFEASERAFQTLVEDAPKLSSLLENCPDDEVWVRRAPRLQAAWDHARARTWVRRVSDPQRATALAASVGQFDQSIRGLLAEIASAYAWQACFENMSEAHRRQLIRWQQAIRRLGKGTGKYAPKWRKEAQQALDECRDAIPGWVMPLHVLYSTVDPKPEMFDVIVVDEASQCGPDALPLMFLAKRIVVVGDDKQISPEAVGVNQGDVDQLIREHLGSLEHRDSFVLESSLFDHAHRRFRDRIVLREHFRCMPEIIRFSNDLCYQTTPLDPLRQYPPDRLEPIVALHVSGGFREGSGQGVLNRPEAQAIVDAIVECDGDRRYDGMTFGVIALQGTAQARLIENLLLERSGIDVFLKRKLVCGEAYSFQGDERDVVFLSLVAAPNARAGALTRAPDERRFNVAASRARDQMWLFHSVMPSELSEVDLRRRLLEFFLSKGAAPNTSLPMSKEDLEHVARTAERSLQSPPSPFESWFEVDVCLALLRRKYRVRAQYPVGGYRIDLVVEGNRQRLAVECDGDEWHGEMRYQEDVLRQRKLERCGWTFWRVRGSTYYASRENALEPLWPLLAGMGIFPGGEEAEQSPIPAPVAASMVPSESSSAGGTPSPPPAPPAERPLVEPLSVKPPPCPAGPLWGGPEVPETQQTLPIEDDRRKPQGEFSGRLRLQDGLGLLPYVPWTGPRPPDPREGPQGEVANVIAAIVEQEQPVILDCVYRRYARAVGIEPIGRVVRSLLNRAAQQALSDRTIVSLGHNPPSPIMCNLIVATHRGRAVFPRELGDRRIDDVPVPELLAMAKQVMAQGQGQTIGDIVVLLASELGIERCTPRIREHLEACLRGLEDAS